MREIKLAKCSHAHCHPRPCNNWASQSLPLKYAQMWKQSTHERQEHWLASKYKTARLSRNRQAKALHFPVWSLQWTWVSHCLVLNPFLEPPLCLHFNVLQPCFKLILNPPQMTTLSQTCSCLRAWTLAILSSWNILHSYIQRPYICVSTCMPGPPREEYSLTGLPDIPLGSPVLLSF